MERNGTEGFDGPNCSLTLDLIREATLAGGNSIAARAGSLGRGGFEKLADKHSACVAALAGELVLEATLALLAASADDSHDFDEV